MRCSLAVAFFGSFFGKGKKNRETCFTTKTRRISFSKEAEAKTKAEKGRQETVSRKLGLAICDLEFGIWDFSHLVACSSKTKKIRLRMVIGHWSLVIGHWSLVIGHWSLVIGHWSLVIGDWSLVDKLVINTTSFLIHELKKSNESCHFYLKKL